MSEITSAKSPARRDKIRKGGYGGVLQEHVWHGDVEKATILRSMPELGGS